MYESRISWEAEKFADYFDLLADRENFRNHRRFLVYCVFEIRFYINLDILIGIHFISFLFFFFYFRPIISNRMKWKIDSLIPSMTINFSTNGRVFIRDNSIRNGCVNVHFYDSLGVPFFGIAKNCMNGEFDHGTSCNCFLM